MYERGRHAGAQLAKCGTMLFFYSCFFYILQPLKGCLVTLFISRQHALQPLLVRASVYGCKPRAFSQALAKARGQQEPSLAPLP